MWYFALSVGAVHDDSTVSVISFDIACILSTMPLLNRPAHSKATLGDRSFSFASSSVWNSIPNDVRCAPSLSSFKSRLKTYLFRSVYKDWTVSLITVHMCMVLPCYGFVDGLS